MRGEKIENGNLRQKIRRNALIVFSQSSMGLHKLSLWGPWELINPWSTLARTSSRACRWNRWNASKPSASVVDELPENYCSWQDHDRFASRHSGRFRYRRKKSALSYCQQEEDWSVHGAAQGTVQHPGKLLLLKQGATYWKGVAVWASHLDVTTI